MTRTATGFMTVITGTTTIGMTAKTTPIAGISRSGTESTGPLLKCERENKGREPADKRYRNGASPHEVERRSGKSGAKIELI